MLIQILLAVYNGEKFIQEQIASLLNQTYPSLQLIIRDNCSTDKTVSLLESIKERYPEKVTLLLSKKNDGVIGNFEKLAEHATAPYVMFSDADDVWHKDKVSLSFQKMQAMEQAFGKDKPLLVHSDLTVVNRDLQEIHKSFWSYSKINPLKGHKFSRQLVQNVVTGCTTLVNRPLLEHALPFPDHIIMHDWWLGLVATALGLIGVVPEPTMLYRQHGGNDTGAKKYGLFSFIKRIKNPKEKEKIAQNIEKKFQQALALKNRFQKEMSYKNLLLIDSFLQLKEASFFKKRYLIFKNGFYKQGLLRNIFEFLPTEWILK